MQSASASGLYHMRTRRWRRRGEEMEPTISSLHMPSATFARMSSSGSSSMRVRSATTLLPPWAFRSVWVKLGFCETEKKGFCNLKQPFSESISPFFG